MVVSFIRIDPKMAAERRQQGLRVSGRGSGEGEALAGAGMVEGEGVGVEGLALERLDRAAEGEGDLRVAKARAVDRIADDRVADVGAVDADLMGAAGLEARLEEGKAGEALQDFQLRQRRTGWGLHGCGQHR